MVKEGVCPFWLASSLPKSSTLMFWVFWAFVVWPTSTPSAAEGDGLLYGSILLRLGGRWPSSISSISASLPEFAAVPRFLPHSSRMPAMASTSSCSIIWFRSSSSWEARCTRLVRGNRQRICRREFLLLAREGPARRWAGRWPEQSVLGAFLSLPFPFLLPSRAHLDLVKVVAAGEVMVLVTGSAGSSNSECRFMLRRCYWKQWMIWFIIPNQLTWQQCDWE